MKYSKWYFVLLVALMIIGVSGYIYAQERVSAEKGGFEKNRMPGEGRPDPIQEVARNLGIQPDTFKQLMDINRQMEKELVRIKADQKIAKMDLEDLVINPSSSEQDIKAAAQRISKTADEEINARLKALFAAKKILTPEQYEKVVRLIMKKEGDKEGKAGKEKKMNRGKEPQQMAPRPDFPESRPENMPHPPIDK